MKMVNVNNLRMVMKMEFLAALFLMTSCVACSVKKLVGSRGGISEYPLMFEDATGVPYKIKASSGIVFVEFDVKNSDIEAMQTLENLTAEVLYPNAEGKIKVQGWINEDGKTFVLKHWYIAPGFKRAHFSERAASAYRETTSQLLTPDDFRMDVLHSYPNFSPLKYSRPK